MFKERKRFNLFLLKQLRNETNMGTPFHLRAYSALMVVAISEEMAGNENSSSGVT